MLVNLIWKKKQLEKGLSSTKILVQVLHSGSDTEVWTQLIPMLWVYVMCMDIGTSTSSSKPAQGSSISGLLVNTALGFYFIYI